MPKAGMFMFWSHKRRLPEQLTPEARAYYAEQKNMLRPLTYLRLHENRWVSSESTFIDREQWLACVDPSRVPLLSGGVLYLGVDVGIKSDNAAVVSVQWDKPGQKIVVANHRVWRPTREQPVNLQDIEDYILELRKRHRIVRVFIDPYQAYAMIQSLQKKMGVTIVQEFPQTVPNTTVMGEELYSLIKNKNIVSYPDSELQAHITNATGVETARGFRIAKEKSSKKIDLAVALAMACCAALQAGKPVTTSALPVGIGHGIGYELKKVGEGLSVPMFSSRGNGRLSEGIPARSDYDDDVPD